MPHSTFGYRCWHITHTVILKLSKLGYWSFLKHKPKRDKEQGSDFELPPRKKEKGKKKQEKGMGGMEEWRGKKGYHGGDWTFFLA